MLETNEGARRSARHVRGLPGRLRQRPSLRQQSGKDAVMLVIGDRTPFDEITYPDIDNHAKAGADGKYVYTRRTAHHTR